MDLTIQGTHLALTDDLRRLVEEKLADALRPLGNTDLDPLQVRVEIEHRERHHDKAAAVRPYRAEVTLTGYGRTFRAEGAADELLRAVVEMKHELSRQLRAWRGQLRDARRAGARRAKQLE